ncbi:MAG: hypothetical protein WAK58_19310, partial [Trebonia sp.]
MDQSAEGQLRAIRKVIAVTQSPGIPVWLFGGWGLDARIGRITREHGDVEFWVERIHAERSKTDAHLGSCTGAHPEFSSIEEW